MEIEVTAILLQIFNFGIVVVGLTFLLIKPVKKILAERSNKIAEGQKAAEKAMSDRDNAEKVMTKAEREAQLKAKTLLDEARKDAKKVTEGLIHEAEEEASKIRERAQEATKKERESMVAGLQSQFEEAVVAVSTSVVGSAVSAKQHQDLIKKGLQEIASA